MSDGAKIFPRNLTARAAARVTGNPDISRPEDVVANCFPGLDMDLRNLDRRFFPGLVFEFVSAIVDDDPWCGARVLYCDALGDPDLQPDYLEQLKNLPPEADDVAALTRAAVLKAVTARQRSLLAQLVNDGVFAALNGAPPDIGLTQDAASLAAQRQDGIWFLHSVEQFGRKILFQTQDDHKTVPMDGITVWRLIRSLEPGAVKIELRLRRTGENLGLVPVSVEVDDDWMVFLGWRRLFTNLLTGVLSGAYQPGELTMSMCSPWQHDFRDCACHYWASNRPDVVYGEVFPGEPVLPGGASADPLRATTRLDWMRDDRSRAQGAGALSSMFANRPFQKDHFQISQDFEKLNIVLRNTEIGEVYTPPDAEYAAPFDSPEELYDTLHGRLAGLEMTLALEYLYASFSLKAAGDPVDPRFPEAGAHAEMARHALRLTAVSEMQHLRWANELLWRLAAAFFPPGKYVPALEPALLVPVPDRRGLHRRRALRAFTPDTLQQFIAIEQPSGGLDGLYARVIATLAQSGYPGHFHALVSRIANDGTEHFSRFDALRTRFVAYGDATPYLRDPFVVGDPENPMVAEAVALFEAVKASLRDVYARMALQSDAPVEPLINTSRDKMHELLRLGDMLAASGFGIPFWT